MGSGVRVDEDQQACVFIFCVRLEGSAAPPGRAVGAGPKASCMCAATHVIHMAATDG
jgi:hypothetical protein